MKLSKEEIQQLNEFIFCEWDKRKKCDSLYQEKYNELAKRVHKAIDLTERLIKEYKLNYGEELSKTLMAYNTLLEILKEENN